MVLSRWNEWRLSIRVLSSPTCGVGSFLIRSSLRSFTLNNLRIIKGLSLTLLFGLDFLNSLIYARSFEPEKLNTFPEKRHYEVLLFLLKVKQLLKLNKFKNLNHVTLLELIPVLDDQSYAVEEFSLFFMHLNLFWPFHSGVKYYLAAIYQL